MTSPIIAPLVTRHAGDAAFYWSRHDDSVHSPLIGLIELIEFDRLLEAHLDGLRVAGEAGWAIALSSLQRWRSSGEAFVCALLALEAPNAGERLKVVWGLVEADPARMLRGLISALAWVTPEERQTWVARWRVEGSPPALQVVAWRASRLGLDDEREGLRGHLQAALGSCHAPVRAAACRLAGELREYERLLPMLSDADEAVRAEAAIAQAPSNTLISASALWQCVMQQLQVSASLTGRPRRDAEHRLGRWVRQLGPIVPLGHPGVAQLLQQLPVRLGLYFVLHHGDGALLPWVARQADHPDAARLAGWVWAALTGVDPEQAGLALLPTRLDDGQVTRLTDDLDPGLPDIDAAALQAAAVPPRTEQPCLWGGELNRERLLDVLRNGPQALRWIAAQRLRLAGGPWFDCRAPARAQLLQLARLAAA